MDPEPERDDPASRGAGAGDAEPVAPAGPDAQRDAGARASVDYSAAQRGPRLGPALVVGGIAVGLVVIFGVLSALTSSQPQAPHTASREASSAVAGTTLRAVPASGGLKPIEEPDTPPADVLDTLALPEGAAQVAHSRTLSSTGQYSAEISFTVGATEATVVAFYKAVLDRQGWKISAVAPAGGIAGGIEVISEKAADDGWYWETGAVVSPTKFSGPHASRQSTEFQIQLFEVPDAE